MRQLIRCHAPGPIIILTDNSVIPDLQTDSNTGNINTGKFTLNHSRGLFFFNILRISGRAGDDWWTFPVILGGENANVAGDNVRGAFN